MREKEIENQILHWLAIHDIFSWKVKTVGTFDTKLGRFRKGANNYMKGVSDILGIYKQRPLAIEVKSKIGKLSLHQKIFLERFANHGGIALVARSVDDVIKGLRAADENELESA